MGIKMGKKCICKQCGKPFEMSDSEMAFYRNRNLNLPRRCKACRAANKKGKAAETDREQSVRNQGTDNISGGGNNKGSKWVYALIAVVTLLVAGLMGISNPDFPPGRAHPAVSAEKEDADGAAPEYKTAGETEESENRNATEATSEIVNDGAGVQNNDAEAGSMAQGGSGTESAKQNDAEADSVQQNGSGTEVPPDTNTVVSFGNGGVDVREYTFRNGRLLEEHFEKHGKEMGFSSAEEYQAAASAVVNHGDALHKVEKEDGDDVYYLEATNEFVIVSTDGFIRTYFKPDSGIDYFNRQ